MHMQNRPRQKGLSLRQCFLITRVLLLTLGSVPAFMALPAVAGVVGSDAPDSVDSGAGLKLSTPGGSSTTPMEQPTVNQKASGELGPSSAAASAAMLAAELMREADVTTNAGEALPAPKRLAAQQAGQVPKTVTMPEQRRASVDGDDWDLKVLGRSAVGWLKERVPWLDANGTSDAIGSSTTKVEWADGTSNPQSVGTADMAPRYGSKPQDTGGRTQPGYERNVVREFVQLIRDLLDHPMTWLVIVLFVVGGIVMSKADRRPK